MKGEGEEIWNRRLANTKAVSASARAKKKEKKGLGLECLSLPSDFLGIYIAFGGEGWGNGKITFILSSRRQQTLGSLDLYLFIFLKLLFFFFFVEEKKRKVYKMTLNILVTWITIVIAQHQLPVCVELHKSHKTFEEKN